MKKMTSLAISTLVVGLSLNNPGSAKSCNANSAAGRGTLVCGVAAQATTTATSTMNGNGPGPVGNIPTANQLPSGNSNPPVTVIVKPLAPTEFTGYGPVPPTPAAVPLQAPSFTGYAPVQQLTPPLAPPLPQQQVPPLPPQQVPPVPVAVGLQGPSFTGYAPVPQLTPPLAPPLPPQQVPPMPVAVGLQGPSFTGYAPVPPINAPIILTGQSMVGASQPNGPGSGGQAEGRQVGKVERPVPSQKPVSSTSASDTPIAHEVTSAAETARDNVAMITIKPGRQDPVDYPAFVGAASGQVKGCVVSGLDRRRVISKDSVDTYEGTLPQLRTVSMVIADIPSWHPHDPGCIVSIRKK